MTGLTRRLAEWAHRTTFRDLPSDVREKVKDIVLDQLGCEVASASLPWNKIVFEYVQGMDGRGRSTVLRFGLRTNAEYAALANGTFGHGFELDDYHIPALSHPGCVAVPAVLSVAEAEGLAGPQIMAAVATASEMIIRFGLAAGVSLVIERGFHETCIEGTLGTALGLGGALGLDVDRIVNAVGIAGSHSSGTIEYGQTGGDVKRLHAGLGALGGVRSVLLARAGLTAPATILEGKRGILQAFTNHYDASLLTDGLGSTHRLLELAFKPYACVGLIHPQIDAASALMERHRLRPDDIEEIDVGADRFTLSHVGTVGPEPRDITGAQCSAHFSLALTVVRRRNDFRAYMDAWERRFQDQDVIGMARRVRLVLDPEIDQAFPKAQPARVTITTRTGRRLTERVDAATGTRGNPLSRDDLIRKFLMLATTAIEEGAASQVVDRVLALERLSSAADLTALLTASS